ncbi:MAG: 3D domain-containing protein [Firmicutes bacterium]|nr:3D domain-containing protein [Bacillota bacterium]
MEIDFHRIKSLFSLDKEWRYEGGVLRHRFKKSIYPKVVAAVLFLVVLVTSIVYNTLKKDIIICDADKKKTIITFKATVEDVLDEKNIIVGPFDKLEASPDQKLKKGMEIEIKRAKSVKLIEGNREHQIYTLAETVGEAMEEAGVYLGVEDRVEPSPETELKHADKIEVIRVEYRIFSDIEEIPFENEIKKSDTLEKGFVKVLKKGQEGKREIVQSVVFENGKEVLKEILKESILQNPVAAILEEGTKDTVVTSRGTVAKFTKAIEMVSTAYDATFASTGKHPDHPQYGITRSGLKVRPGIVAVDPRVIPLGTHLYVEGYGEALAADTGGAIKGNKIDLYFESPKDVAKYGRKRVKVYILDKPRYRF